MDCGLSGSNVERRTLCSSRLEVQVPAGAVVQRVCGMHWTRLCGAPPKARMQLLHRACAIDHGHILHSFSNQGGGAHHLKNMLLS